MVRPLGQAHGVLDHGQGAQAQEIHFQKPQLLQGRHRELRGDRTVGRARQGHIFIHRGTADHHPRGVHGGVARQALKALAHIDQIFNLPVALIRISQIRAGL